MSKSNSQLQEHPPIKNGNIFEFKSKSPPNTFQNQAEITLNSKGKSTSILYIKNIKKSYFMV